MAIFGAAKSILSPHLVDWYTDIYTNVYGYDNLYKQVLSQFNTYLKEWSTLYNLLLLQIQS